MLKNATMLHFYKVSVDILEEVWWVHSAMSLSTKSRTPMWVTVLMNNSLAQNRAAVFHEACMNCYLITDWICNVSLEVTICRIMCHGTGLCFMHNLQNNRPWDGSFYKRQILQCRPYGPYRSPQLTRKWSISAPKPWGRCNQTGCTLPGNWPLLEDIQCLVSYPSISSLPYCSIIHVWSNTSNLLEKLNWYTQCLE